MKVPIACIGATSTNPLLVLFVIGIYSFGHRAPQPDGSFGSTAPSIADLMEGVRRAGAARP